MGRLPSPCAVDADRRAHRPDRPERGVLVRLRRERRVLEHLGDRAHGTAGNADALHQLEPLGNRTPRDRLREHGRQRVAVAHALGVCREPGVLEELGERRLPAEAGELCVRADRDDHVSVERAEALVRHDRRVGVAEAHRHLAGDEVVGCAVREPCQLGVEQRHLDVAARACRLGLAERGEDPDGRVHPRGDVGDRHADLHRVAVGLARDRHDPALALDREVEAGPACIRSVVRVAGDRAVDERGRHSRSASHRVRGARRRPAGSSRSRCRPALPGANEPDALGILEVDANRALAAIRREEVRRLALNERWTPAARWVAALPDARP